MTTAIIAIHGGAGALSRATITPQQQAAYETALNDILVQSGAVLEQGGSALDAVTLAVRLLEDCPLFNAGYGSVFTSAATHEMDAAIMDGATLGCGSVASVSTVRNPVLAARAVMETSEHVFFCGKPAEALAAAAGLEMVEPDYFSTPLRREQLDRVRASGEGGFVLDHDAVEKTQDDRTAPLDEDKKLGTVGAVALDQFGNLAAATSTGGMTNKQPGRVGDSPIIGAGCYANNHSCAVSSTGTGEMFIRSVAAYDVAAQMQYGARTLAQAADNVVFNKLPAIGGVGGLIAIDAQGNVALPFNSEGMYRGYLRVGQEPFVGIYR
ncbi:isoaspartyl peptidase/L-asparaginase family protein [Advenella mimigardefordensis]|uniref:Isoaspartyl peptidase n=1 Tax=Advenella mimigardefordensis (strain DSM 17166 / LMG 22922 / DPN7) TaxID=1247726 RepID=W0P772_ADVMD|nr:isoaspartyl peptidase/L-asparaginase [Advenella mimigardefordensis]AHG62689.1 isoaspartyl peptidase [Advenella mimigardefordensis DPN7]